MDDLSTDIAALVATSADPDMRYVIGSPSQLATLIKAMDLVDARAPYIRACLVMGGAVSPHLQQAAARIFGGSVMTLYGSTELGACASYVAAFKFTDSNGIEILIIAAVASGDDAYAELKVDLLAAVRAFQCPVGFFPANAIARNAMGKPIRAMLAEQMQAAINRAAAASNAIPPSVQPTGHGLI